MEKEKTALKRIIKKCIFSRKKKIVENNDNPFLTRINRLSQRI